MFSVCFWVCCFQLRFRLCCDCVFLVVLVSCIYWCVLDFATCVLDLDLLWFWHYTTKLFWICVTVLEFTIYCLAFNYWSDLISFWFGANDLQRLIFWSVLISEFWKWSSFQCTVNFFLRIDIFKINFITTFIKIEFFYINVSGILWLTLRVTICKFFDHH